MSYDNTNESHGHHVTPIKTLATVFGLLLVGMVATVAWAEFSHNLPDTPLMSFLNNVIAMAIAVFKAALVIAIFMGVKYGTRLIKFYALLGFAWVFWLLIAFCDYGTRNWEPVPGWEKNQKISYVTGGILPTKENNVPRQMLQQSPRQP